MGEPRTAARSAIGPTGLPEDGRGVAQHLPWFAWHHAWNSLT
jgi:hypothetical protein